MVSSNTVDDVDVVIVGGGPGGSTLAALVAMQGHSVVLLEKEKFPRYQIGESLLPATVHGVCQLTGVAGKLAQCGFTLKRGGTFKWGSSPEPWTFSFALSPKFAGSTAYAYQVERSKFDKVLLDHAKSVGVDVREHHTVTEVLAKDGRVCGVAYTDAAGLTGRINARYVADASGNRSRIYQSVGGVRKYSDFFRSVALFGYFEGGERLPAPNSGNILSAAFDSGWFWYIPLSETLTSVGAVVRRELAQKIQGDPEEALRNLIQESPLISDYLRDAVRVTEGAYGQLRVRKDYSYHNTKFWRPGMVLVGDAACFIDPVFSSGVHLATYSGLLAARSINSVLASAVDEHRAFQEFELRYRREFAVFYEFLMACYNTHVSERSYFWSAKKVTQNTRPELESFVELVGGVSSGEYALVGNGTLTQHFRDRSENFARAVNMHVEQQEQSMSALFKASVVRPLWTEGAQIQAQAMLGTKAEPEVPLYDNGLVAAPDGMSWTVPG